MEAISFAFNEFFSVGLWVLPLAGAIITLVLPYITEYEKGYGRSFVFFTLALVIGFIANKAIIDPNFHLGVRRSGIPVLGDIINLITYLWFIVLEYSVELFIVFLILGVFTLILDLRKS